MIFWIFSFYVRCSTLLHLPPLRSRVSEVAGIESRTVATTGLAGRRSNHSAISHPYIPYFLGLHMSPCVTEKEGCVTFVCRNEGTRIPSLNKGSRQKMWIINAASHCLATAQYFSPYFCRKFANSCIGTGNTTTGTNISLEVANMLHAGSWTNYEQETEAKVVIKHLHRNSWGDRGWGHPYATLYNWFRSILNSQISIGGGKWGHRIRICETARLREPSVPPVLLCVIHTVVRCTIFSLHIFYAPFIRSQRGT